MIIAPKLGEDNIVLERNIISSLSSKVEIQMRTKDLKESILNCTKVINSLSKHVTLDEVVLHMPFTLHTFDVYVASSKHRDKLIKFLDCLKVLSKLYNIKIGVLFHQESSTELMETVDPEFKVINDMLNYISNDDIYFLIENCLPCMNDYNIRILPAFRLLDLVKHEKLFSCIDICHIRCYENIFRTSLDIPTTISERVKWIHFSYTANQDGYIDKNTHGIKHPNLQSLYMDLEFLVDNNIDISSIPIVAEITEKDYKLYPDMIEEISLLNVLNKNSNFVHSKLSPRRNIV